MGQAKIQTYFVAARPVAFPNKKYNNNNKMEILAIPIMNPIARYMILF